MSVAVTVAVSFPTATRQMVTRKSLTWLASSPVCERVVRAAGSYHDLMPANRNPRRWEVRRDGSSWRDSASQQCQDDLDGLLNLALRFARQMLDKRGEFYQFGAAMSTGGEARLLGGDPSRDASTAVLPVLLDGLRHDRADFRAVAICSYVRLPDSDAVRVELEHQEGQAVHFVVPYNKKRTSRGVEYGEPRRGTPFRQVWT